MPVRWTWQDIAELAHELAHQYSDMDPLSVLPAELKRMVASLPTFGDDPEAATTDILEAIQAAWYEETME
jgi:FeS assembly protein IscX